MSEYGRERRARALDELPLGVLVARAPTGETVYTNQSFRTMMGMEAASEVEAAAAAVYEVFDRQGNPYPVENLPFGRALVRGEPLVVDDMVIHRGDGSRVCVRAFANPVRDEKGVVSHVVIAFTDITAEVRAMVERAKVEKHLEVAIHHAPVLLFMMDRASVVTAADGALRAILEAGNAGIIGRSLLEAYKSNPVVVENVRRALAGETVSYSVAVRDLMLDVWIGPVRNAAGELAGAIGICTDVTEGRRLQARIVQADRMHAMGTVAASIAHEINNPLTYVLAGLEQATRELESLSTDFEALRRSGYDAVATTALRALDRLKEHLDPVAEGTRRIRDVARDLKAFTRPDDERLTQIDVAGVVRSALGLWRKEIEARARLVEEIGASPPVRANEARLVQVLTNLLINAWQALPAPDPTRHVIGVRSGSLDGDAVIEIWDSGPGVLPEVREKIFEPFVTTKDIGMGTGLGLFVCRNIINALQGRITVHDAPGGGALFQIILPAAAERTFASPAAPTVQPAMERKNHRPRILIIDDDALVADALARQLAGDFFEVRTVLDARQGLEIVLADDGLDLVYCDVMMKDFTGIDLHQALRQRAPQRLSKVVFMTGGAFTGHAQAFIDQQRDAHVQKPFDVVADARRRVGLTP